MSDCYHFGEASSAVPIKALTVAELPVWLADQDADTKAWVNAMGFGATPGRVCLLPGAKHQVVRVLLGAKEFDGFWHFGGLPALLPKGIYCLEPQDFPDEASFQRALFAWGLGCYQFNAYRTREPFPAKLVVPDALQSFLSDWLSTTYLIRDLINTPAEDMGPPELAEAVRQVAAECGATVNVIEGEALVEEGFGAIYAVGRAGSRLPCLIDLTWGNEDDFKLTLVGKGVCFDSGGLDLKTSDGMLIMKKDMGGAAHALGLARMIMKHRWPVRLRVLIPAVENAVGSRSYRPGDVLQTRGGLSVEVNNTDAEGRLVVGDALALAVEDDPDLLIDFTTLTGDARRALGVHIPVFFSNNDEIAAELIIASNKTHDPLWRLPLHQPYREYLRSEVATISNVSRTPAVGAGAIMAALFLETFVSNQVPWVHVDFYAWNLESLPGRPLGGEMMTLRAVFQFLQGYLNLR